VSASTCLDATAPTRLRAKGTIGSRDRDEIDVMSAAVPYGSSKKASIIAK